MIKPTLRSQINITPYIDILLVLLIIFMVIQPTAQYDLETRVPLPAPQSPLAAPVIVVSIDADWRIAVNQEAVELPHLGTRLFEILRARSDRRMFVQAVDELPFGAVAKIIDVAKGAGAGEVGLLLK